MSRFEQNRIIEVFPQRIITSCSSKTGQTRNDNLQASFLVITNNILNLSNFSWDFLKLQVQTTCSFIFLESRLRETYLIY